MNSNVTCDVTSSTTTNIKKCDVAKVSSYPCGDHVKSVAEGSYKYIKYHQSFHSTCAICTRKVRASQSKITCIQCSLDFHIDCVSIDYDNASFWCDSCFYRTCLNELPFCNEPFIDYNCKMSKGLKIAHLNVQSLRNKVDHVRVLLNDNNIDILCLTETC